MALDKFRVVLSGDDPGIAHNKKTQRPLLGTSAIGDLEYSNEAPPETDEAC
jgi:hypothetical protein